MEIPMTNGIDVPELNDILASGIINNEITKQIPLYGYAGNHAKKKPTKEQLGSIIYFKDGLVFLQAEGAIQALKESGKLPEFIKNSRSFAVPYVQIVKAEHEKVGFFLNKRLYLVLTQQPDGDEKRTYYFTPARGDFPLHDKTDLQIMYYRMESERELLSAKELQKYIDRDKLRKDIEKEYGADFGGMKPEVIKELNKRSEEVLKKHNITMDDMNERISSKLKHFLEDSDFTALCLLLSTKYKHLS